MSDAELSSNGDVVTSITIAAPPDAVFDHLVDPDKLIRWFGVEADIDPRPGGKFWLNVTGKDTASGAYVEVNRPSRVSFTWGWEGSEDVPPGSSMVSIDLKLEGDETLLVLTHSGLPMGADDAHKQGWVHLLERLQVVGAGGDPGPDPWHQTE